MPFDSKYAKKAGINLKEELQKNKAPPSKKRCKCFGKV
jgi:hypothetical protein